MDNNDTDNNDIDMTKEDENQNKKIKEANKFLTDTEAKLFINSREVAYIKLRHDGKIQTMEIGSSPFKKLVRFIFLNQGKFLSEYKLTEMVNLFAAMALYSGNRDEVNHRVGNLNGDIIYDIGNENHECIYIDKYGWNIRKESPISFERSNRQLAIPIPPKMDDLSDFLDDFRSLFNLDDEDCFILILTFIVKAIMKNYGAYPILVIDGVQGSGKTTSTNIIKRLIGSTSPNLLSPPKTSDDIIIMSKRSNILGFDNLSGLTYEMADTLCRVSTGAGIEKRGLFTNDEEMSYDILKPIIINGIGEPSSRPDFIDRTITIRLVKLDSSKRISEMEMLKKFDKLYAKLLGGIFTIISKVIAMWSLLPTTGLQRMTEYHRTGIAIEKIFKLPNGFFTQVYTRNIEAAEEEIFAGDAMCDAIQEYFTRHKKHGHRFGNKPLEITGTATEILRILSKDYKKIMPGMPKSASTFTNKLSRFEMVLNRKGYYFEKMRTDDRRELRLWFVDPEEIADL